MNNKLSIVIPVYNEAKSLEIIVSKVLSIKLPNNMGKELILVNDGSIDKSWEIIVSLSEKNPEIKKLDNIKNIGKSQSVKNGILFSTGDFVVIQDADLEYEPAEIVDLINLAVGKGLDVVYGNRFGKKNKVIYFQNYLGNKFLSFVSNIFTYPRIGLWIPDMEVCYKLVNGDILRDLAKNIESKSNFGIEPEVTAKLSRYKRNGKHLKFGIVPISYYPRSIQEGKKMKAVNDGIKALKEILRFNLFS